VDLLGLPVVVLTHPSDLYNPSCDGMAIDLFRYYYARADLVIAHGLVSLPSDATVLGGRAREVVESNTLIRTPLARTGEERRKKASPLRGGNHIVGVLGGGSENVISSFRATTAKLAEWSIEACDREKVSRLTLFCADVELHNHLASRGSWHTDLELIASQVDNTAALIKADIIMGRSGRNLVSEVLALGTRSLIVTVSAEKYRLGAQQKTAEFASRISPVICWTTLEEGFDVFHSAFRATMNAPPRPPVWMPGNEVIANRLPGLLDLLGLTLC